MKRRCYIARPVRISVSWELIRRILCLSPSKLYYATKPPKLFTTIHRSIHPSLILSLNYSQLGQTCAFFFQFLISICWLDVSVHTDLWPLGASVFMLQYIIFTLAHFIAISHAARATPTRERHRATFARGPSIHCP